MTYSGAAEVPRSAATPAAPSREPAASAAKLRRHALTRAGRSLLHRRIATASSPSGAPLHPQHSHSAFTHCCIDSIGGQGCNMGRSIVKSFDVKAPEWCARIQREACTSCTQHHAGCTLCRSLRVRAVRCCCQLSCSAHVERSRGRTAWLSAARRTKKILHAPLGAKRGHVHARQALVVPGVTAIGRISLAPADVFSEAGLPVEDRAMTMLGRWLSRTAVSHRRPCS